MARGVGAGVELNRLASVVVMEIDQSMFWGLAGGGAAKVEIGRNRCDLGGINSGTTVTCVPEQSGQGLKKRNYRVPIPRLDGFPSILHPMEPSFKPRTLKLPQKPHLCRPRGCPCRCDTVHGMLCFVRAEDFIRSGAVSVPCYAVPTSSSYSGVGMAFLQQ